MFRVQGLGSAAPVGEFRVLGFRVSGRSERVQAAPQRKVANSSGDGCVLGRAEGAAPCPDSG